MDCDWLTFIDAIALVFIIEGIMPFLRPESYKRYMQIMCQQSDGSIRIFGLVSMIIGCGVLYLVRLFFDF